MLPIIVTIFTEVRKVIFLGVGVGYSEKGMGTTPPVVYFLKPQNILKLTFYLPPRIYCFSDLRNTYYIYTLPRTFVPPSEYYVCGCPTNPDLLKCHNLRQIPRPLGISVDFDPLCRQGNSSCCGAVTYDTPPLSPPPPPPLIQSMLSPAKFSLSGSLGTTTFYACMGQ